MFKKLFSRFTSDDAAAPEVTERHEQTTGQTDEAGSLDNTDMPTAPPVTEEAPATESPAAETSDESLTYVESSGPSADQPPVDKEDLKNRVTDMMRTIFDPEIPVNIYDIGLIYKIEPDDDGIVDLTMTLTTPNCPAAGILPGEVENKAKSVDGVREVRFELTFDPPWNPDMMSEGAKLELGMM